VEEIYQLVWTAVANKQPMEAATRGGLDYSAPHRLGRKGGFACCVISMAAKARPGLQTSVSFTNWHCVALEKLSRVKVLEASGIQPDHSRPGSCVAEPDIDAEDQPERDPQKGH